MAEERNLAVARAVADEAGDEDATKAELQRRMEEARESITQTVTEIKDTVANQYQAVRQSVTDALDWREQYRRRPVAWSVGALSVGFLVGYSLGGAFMGDGEDREDYLSYAEDYEPGSTAEAAGVSYPPYDSERVRPTTGRSIAAATPSYAAQSTAGAGYGTSYGQRMSSPAAPQSVSDYQTVQGSAAAAAEPEKPGVLERFKETKAYDRLQEEVANLGDRLLDELSKVGQTVVLPALFNKVKEMFGVDLSNKQKGQSSSGGTGTSGASTASTGGAQATGGTDYSRREEDRSQTVGSASGGGAGASYGTSENRGYGSSS